MRRALTVLLVLFVGTFIASTAAAQPVKRVEYYHLDALGSVRAVTDQQGHEIERHDYLPFGEEWPQPAFRSTRLFAGKERDAESALDYFGARSYSSSTGRFITVDPVMDADVALVDPQAFNRYAYVTNNPFRYIDPDGRDRFPMMIPQGVIARNAAIRAKVREIFGANDPDQGRISRMAETVADVLLAPFLPQDRQEFSSSAESALFGLAGGRGIGAEREALVAKLTGGRVAGDMKVLVPNLGTASVDVIGGRGEFITVGGFAKSFKLSNLGRHLQLLKAAADQAGVVAQAWFAPGTPQSVLKLATKWLGAGNVFIIPTP